MKTLGALARPPYRLRMIAAVILGVIAGMVAWDLGLDPLHSTEIGLAALVAVAVLGALPGLPTGAWRRSPGSVNGGGRQDIVQLSWALNSRRDWVGDGVQTRLREIARRRLDHLGLDLDDPHAGQAIAKLVGLETYGILRPGSVRQASLAALSRALHELDRLDRRPTDQPETDEREKIQDAR
jgi:hypothetical protein